MKTFLFACAALLAACVDTTAPGADLSDIENSYVCASAADCPGPAVCGPNGECVSPTAVPLPAICASDAECGPHERCNTVCPTASGIVRHVCEPDGIATHVCYVHPRSTAVPRKTAE